MHSAHQVHVQYQLKVCHLHLGKAFVTQNTRVIDQNIHPTPSVHGLLHHPLHGHCICHRRLIRKRLPACCKNLSGHRLRGGPKVIHQHFGPSCGQGYRVLAAQATPSAGNDGNAAFEFNRHRGRS